MRKFTVGNRSALLFALLGLGITAGARAASDVPPVPPRIKQLLADTGMFWGEQFKQLGGRYQPATLALYSSKETGVCRQAMPMVGAFYCPSDQHLYIDPASLEAIATRAHADGEVAEGLLIAHLVAHHVQYLIGTTASVQQARSTSTPENANHTLITMELQADCYAGLWLHSAAQRGVVHVTGNSVPAAVAAIAAESAARSRALPAGMLFPDPMDSGTAAQRLRWTKRGVDSGKFDDCDTFGAVAKGDL